MVVAADVVVAAGVVDAGKTGVVVTITAIGSLPGSTVCAVVVTMIITAVVLAD